MVSRKITWCMRAIGLCGEREQHVSDQKLTKETAIPKKSARAHVFNDTVVSHSFNCWRYPLTVHPWVHRRRCRSTSKKTIPIMDITVTTVDTTITTTGHFGVVLNGTGSERTAGRSWGGRCRGGRCVGERFGGGRRVYWWAETWRYWNKEAKRT